MPVFSGLACGRWIPGLGGFLVGGSEYAIRALREDDPEVISAAFTALGWDKPVSQYEKYVAQQIASAWSAWPLQYDRAAMHPKPMHGLSMRHWS